jgi:hypothetical protein
VTNMKFDSSHASSAALDARTLSEMAVALAAMRGQSPRGQLACKWERSAEGRHACILWGVDPHEAVASHSRFLAEPLPAKSRPRTRSDRPAMPAQLQAS